MNETNGGNARSDNPPPTVVGGNSFRLAQLATGTVITFTRYSIACANRYPRAIAPIKLSTRVLFSRSNIISPRYPSTVLAQTVEWSCAINAARHNPCCAKDNKSSEKIFQSPYKEHAVEK